MFGGIKTSWSHPCMGWYDGGVPSHHSPKHGVTMLALKHGAWPMLEPSYEYHTSTNSRVRSLNIIIIRISKQLRECKTFILLSSNKFYHRFIIEGVSPS